MKLYSSLSKISFLKKRYIGKFLFVGFLGILLPVILLFIFVVNVKTYLAPLDLFLIILTLIIVGTVIMVMIVKGLMLPILKAHDALLDYETTLKVPQLPTDFTDEAGVLLKNIQVLILMNQKLLADKKELCDVLTTDLRHQTLNTEMLINAISKESTGGEVKKLASEAIQSVNQQINFVDSYVEILGQEDLINKQPIKIRKVNVQELLDEVKTKRKAILEAKDISLTFNLKYSRIRLKVSNTLLLQAYGYLVDNAIKHAPHGSKIEISTEKFRGKLIFQIKDYGIGFDGRQAEKIFSKFQHGETEGSYSPTPGVYLTSQIIERFGGTIVAESDGIHQGAKFIIELKLQR